MKIDLRRDFTIIYNYVERRVTDYPEYVNIGPGIDKEPISQITLGYQISQAGWVALVFDTRLNGSPDGEWQSYIGENALEMEHWLEAVDALYEKGESIQLVLTNGKKKKIGEDDDIAESIGKMLKEVLIHARKNQIFSKLPIADKCSMGIEDHDGSYGWPNFESRYKDGSVT